ncbi:MAG: hypothetical protein E7403_03260 [Ruminococcaceae bacterium]|nr:hypothetical protein [Oscillospiraceae bacterium]
MGEDSTELVDKLMAMLGDNPTETVGKMLSALSDSKTEGENEDDTEEGSGIGFDPALLIKLQGLMGELGNSEQDKSSALLSAIKPFLSDEKKPKVDQAIKLLKLSRIAKTAQDLDLFKGLL